MWWRKKRRPTLERPLVEALEPRIMYAADLGAGMLAAATIDMPGAIEMRVLDAGGDYAAPAPVQDTITAAAAPPATGRSSAAAQASLPLNFETNAGQADASIDFIARGNGVGIALSDANATLVLKNGTQGNVVQMTLASATAEAQGQAEGDVTARSNYLIGSQDQWLQDVANHASVRYDGVYEGIDLRYYGSGRALEYDFIVGAGADWRAIGLNFEGIDQVAIDGDGALRLTLPGGDGANSLRFEAPVSYQMGAGGREAVASRYVLGQDGSVRFDIGAYDASRTLVIDPVLSYGSYLGGTGLDKARAIAVDAAGNAYITGETASAAFPTSAGAYDTSQNGASDVFVTKLNVTGTAVVYSTFVGGSGNDVAWGIATDAAGNAYVTGSTTSTNLPTVNAFQGALSGTQDAFFFELNVGGTALSYSTYLGGSGSGDTGYAIALDAAGNAYLTGDTDSAGGIASVGAYDTTLGGSLDAFLVKFDATQSGAASRIFGTYLGGSSGSSSTDHGLAVAVDASGKAYVAGFTGANNFPTTASAFDSTANGGDDAFLAVFNAAGSALAYSTYLGGAGGDGAFGIAVDAANKVYVSGSAGSGFPTKNAYDATYGGGASDAIVAKLDPALSGSASLIYSTYLGGAGDETALSIALDSLGRAHVTGETTGSMPTTADALQAAYAGGARDAFYATLGSLGNSLVYSTYLGGSGDDAGYAIARDGADNIFIAGHTSSANLQQITGGAYDSTQNGGTDAFVLKFTSQALTVTTTNDVVDGATTSIAALLANKGADGLISLREAIIATNNTAGADMIALPAGTYLLTRAGAGEDVAATGDLDILDALTITGAGRAATVVDGNALDRVLEVQSGVGVTLTDVTLRGGVLAANQWGGGALVDSGASLTLARAIITDNSTGSGAGLYNYGTLTAIDTTVSNNAGAGWGGGIYNDGGVLTLDRATVSDNTAAKDGGGIYNAGSGASMSLTNVTVSSNTATGIGGGIYTNRAITVTSSTIALNSATGGADGIHVQGGGSATLRTTLLYNPAGNNSNTALTSAGNNLDSDGSAALRAAGDLSGTAGTPIDPKLGALQDNGGPTKTHALLAGSAAINAGTATGAPATDARGVARLGATDIGAFESTLIGYEPFAYPAGSFNGANGGSGWAAGWSSVAGNTTVVATGLQNPAVDMQVSGGTAQLTIPLLFGSVAQTRDLATSLGAAASTAWLSFLVKPDSAVPGDYIGLQFGSPSATRAFAGINGSQFVLEQYGSSGRVVVSGITPQVGQTYLLTVKMDFSAGADSMTLYVNPTPGLAGPDSAFTASKNNLDLGTFTQIDLAGARTLFANNAVLDEIRIAASYLDVAPANPQHAPALDAAKSPALNAQNEDASAPTGAVGTLVSSLVDFAGGGGLDNVTDPDSGALTGIAVTAADAANGSWWYSTNGGGNWNALGMVADSNARLLAADASTRLYFQPNANYSGSLGSALTFRAWDQTSGSAGGTANTGTNGGASAFSTATASASITVNPVNDAPAGTNKTVTTNEDTAYTFAATDFGFTDPNDTPANALLVVKITTLPGSGTLTNNGAAVSAGQTITVADINLGRLVFSPAPNANGIGYAAFTFQVQDNGGTANSGIDLDPTPHTLTVNVTAVNDAPVLTGANSLNVINEDPASNNGTLVSALISGKVTDADSAAASGIAVTAVSNTNGTWQYTTDGGGAWTAFGAPTNSVARLLAANANTSVRFVPNTNWNGSVAGGITFRAWDQTSGSAGGIADTSVSGGTSAFSSSTAAAGITVNPVNDAPAGTNATVTTPEDTGYAFVATDFGYSDVNDSPANALLAVKIATLPGVGTLANNGSAVSAGQTITVADINLGRLVFTPGSNANGTGYASFTFQVQDNGGTANGGIDLDASPNSMTVNVTAVNDAPAGTSTTVTTIEDTAYTFSAANFGFTDSSDSPANALLAVKVTTLPGAGTLANNGAAVSAGQTITVADINLGRLVFTPVANATGSGYASFTFQVQDDGGTANGGIDLDASPNTLTINVSAVNDAPVLAGANNLNAINEDVALTSNNGTLVSAMIAGMVTDVDSAAASGIAVTAVSNSNGTWQYTTNGGGAWSAFGTPTSSAARLLAADVNTSVRFVPNANLNGSVAAGITFRAWDQTSGIAGGTANTGTNGGTSAFSTATASAGITVNAVNDAPAGTNNTVSINEDTAYTFTAADFGFTDPNDTPANALNAVRISTLPGAGTLTNNGASVSTGQVVVVADINAGKLKFTPAANANGTGYASFTFQVRDDGGTANGGVNLDASPNTLTVNVSAINDAPVNTVPAAQASAFNVPLVFSSANGNRISVADVDAGVASAQVTLFATNGTLALAGVAGLTFTAGANGAASMAFTGTLASINTALNGLTFTPTSNFAGAATISLLSDDLGNSGAGGPQSDSDTVAITVNASTALNIVGDGFATAEDATLNAASVLGNDSDPALGVMSVVAVNGNAAALGGSIALGSGALLSMHADGTFTYDPNGAFESLAQGVGATDSFTYTVNSTSGGSGFGTAVITLAGANDAPLLSGANDLNDIDEDPGSNNGTLVSALIAGMVTDVDNAAASGIAVVAVDNSNGAWQYTTNGGSAWTAFGTPTNSAALLLAADADTSVRFQPNTNWNGTVNGGIRFMAWDRTSGVAGATADTAVNGGSSAFSSATVGAGITVGAVNDAPEGTNNTVTTNEDTAHTFAASDFGFTDIGDSPANALVAVRIATAPGAGTLANNGTAVSAGQIITAADINLGRLVFTPGANANGAGYASFTFQVQDDGGTADGGIDLDASPNTITLGVTAVNDAPAGADNTVTTSEDSAYTFSAANFGFTDTGDSPANALLAVKVTTLPGAGTLANNGASVSAGQTITVADINLGRLVFTPGSNVNGSGYASFTFQVQDNGGTTNGGIDLDASPNTMTVNVTAVNDAPVLAGANDLNAINEDLASASNNGTLVAALIAGVVTETDSAAASGIAVVAVDNSNGTWEYTTNGGGAWTAFGAPTASTARLLAADASTSVRFVPNANWNGIVAGGVTFRAWDQTAGAAGGTASTNTNGGTSAYSTATASASITVNSVNDAPAGTNTTVTTNEDTAYIFAAADFGFTDSSDSPANTLSAVRVSTLPGAGTLTNNGLAVSSGQTITLADINLGRLAFTPVTNANGTGYASFNFQVQDNGGTASGGVELDASPNTLTLNVTAVNDAPAATDTTVTTNEDTAYTFSAADFGLTDTGDSPANALLAVKIATPPGAGTLTNNGVAVNAGQTVTVADINLGRLAFTPGLNASGAGYASFTFLVQDNGGTANGGIDLDASPDTVTIDVNALNDAPVGADRNVTLFEDSAYTFGAADFAFADSADSPANAWLAVRIASLPGAGALTLNGAAVVNGQFVSAAEIAAGRLVYTPAPDGNGVSYASFSFQVQDDGGTSGGGTDLDPSPRQIRFDVTAINDAPAGTDRSIAVATGTTYVFNVADFGATDPGDSPADPLAAVTIDSLPASGSLRLAGGAVIAGQQVSATDIAAARLSFNAASNGTVGFSFRVQDGGGTANGGIDSEATAHTIRISVATPVASANQTTLLIADGTPPTTSVVTPATATAPVVTAVAPVAAVTPQAASTPPARAVSAAAAADLTDDAAGVGTSSSGLADSLPPGVSARGVPGIEAAAISSTELRAVGTLSGERKGFSFESVTLVDAILASGSRNEVSRSSFDQFLTSLRAQGFIDELDRVRDDAKHEFDLDKSFAVTATGVSFGLSVAYVLWLVRSGVLMGSLLSSLPAWRVLDPLPVLAREGDADEDETDDEAPDQAPRETDHALQTLRGY